MGEEVSGGVTPTAASPEAGTAFLFQPVSPDELPQCSELRVPSCLKWKASPYLMGANNNSYGIEC